MDEYWSEIRINGVQYSVRAEDDALLVQGGGTAKIQQIGSSVETLISAEGDLEAIMAAILYLNRGKVPSRE